MKTHNDQLTTHRSYLVTTLPPATAAAGAPVSDPARTNARPTSRAGGRRSAAGTAAAGKSPG